VYGNLIKILVPCLGLKITSMIPGPAAALPTRPHAAASGPHSTTTGTYTAPSNDRLVGQYHATRLGSLFHLLVMFLADLLSLLSGFRGAHFGVIFGALLLRHKLAYIDLLLLLCLSLYLG